MHRFVLNSMKTFSDHGGVRSTLGPMGSLSVGGWSLGRLVKLSTLF